MKKREKSVGGSKSVKKEKTLKQDPEEESVANDDGRQERSDVFDYDRIEQLVGLMKENSLTEIDLQRGKFRIQLRRGAESGAVAIPMMAPPPAAFSASALPSVAPPAVPAAEKPADDAFVKEITSPMVGTFYSASGPDAPPFVSVGDVIGPEKTVCIIEAMKVFNEIQGEMAGRIVAVLVKDGEPVEFGKPLFKVDTRV